MKLIEINVKNFKSLKNISLKLNGSKTLIIGKNNSGKSNLLNALDIMLKLGGSSQNLPSFNQELDREEYYFSQGVPIKIELIFEIISDPQKLDKKIRDYIEEDGTRKLLRISLEKKKGEDGEFYIGDSEVSYPEYVKKAKFIYFNTIIVPTSRAYVKDLKNDKSSIYSSILRNIIVSVVKSNATEIKNRDDFPDIEFNSYFCKLLSEFLDKNAFISKSIVDFKKIYFSSDYPLKKDILDLISEDFNLYKTTPITDKLNIIVNDGITQDLRLKGMGIQSMFLMSLILEINRFFEIKPIICIDEVELHLHPQAQRRFNDLLSEISKTNQIIATTHSPIFITHTDIFDIILLKKKFIYYRISITK